jgi:hypothetical protein
MRLQSIFDNSSPKAIDTARIEFTSLSKWDLPISLLRSKKNVLNTTGLAYGPDLAPILLHDETPAALFAWSNRPALKYIPTIVIVAERLDFSCE